MTHLPVNSLADTLPALHDVEPDVVVDARGLRCPLPLLKAKQGLRDMAVGGLMQVKATDAGSVKDFVAYAKISGHCLEGFAQQQGEFTYWLRKAP